MNIKVIWVKIVNLGLKVYIIVQLETCTMKGKHEKRETRNDT